MDRVNIVAAIVKLAKCGINIDGIKRRSKRITATSLVL